MFAHFPAGGRRAFIPTLRAGGARASPAHNGRQSFCGAPRGNMSPVWIVLALLPILGGAQRFNCRGRILGAYYADAKSGCKAFHVCVRVAGGGIRDFRFFCPPGTLFHQEAQTCTDWGDDDPLACPADIYDGFDTKKVSTSGNREEESEYGLQRAETGDRRLSQNAGSNGAASDLRAAHSSDFFTGQRDRGRDEPVAQTQAPTSVPPGRPAFQSFRRAPTTRVTYSTTSYTTPSPSPTPKPQHPNPPHHNGPKRKIRKRPIYTPTAPPTTTSAQYTFPPQTYSEQPQQNGNRKNPTYIKQTPTTTVNVPPPYKDVTFPPQTYSEQPQQNGNRKNPTYIKQTPTTTVNVPPQYKDEYVEVSKITPKQNNNRYFSNGPSPTSFSQTTQAPGNKNDGLVELYNYEIQSTPVTNINNNNQPFKLRNSFSVADYSKEPDFVKIRNFNENKGAPTTTTVDYNSVRGTSTPAYRNFNSVSYEPEKNNFASFSGAKQSYYNIPTTTSAPTTIYTTTRIDPYVNLNTVAYNTNIGFNTQSSNYADSVEDDGQYRPPQGEDDGQYRPELYEREAELLSGAHSLNIAASGNRLPEDQKQYKSQQKSAKTSAPRPFRPAPTQSPTTPPPLEYTTTIRPRPEATTLRAFDYYQTYTTTSRPYEPPSVNAYTIPPGSNAVKITTTSAPRTTEHYQPRETAPPTSPPVSYSSKSTKPPYYSKPIRQEDNSYDYAYYDSDPGFSQYDHIEEFGRTKTKV
ncbi:adhesive plaque matrix protein-like isoform X2 [Bicyclus anynana]|uniref:Adhesive plaque matrix protein-like isoform X2 n=1 Tax=Bicyclus anynana TaxID=110368 RepID=A0A6J1MKT6_BICAN|nr:adhesive plaque matrix protein-like isoform X2 [Bicyclus anynana]